MADRILKRESLKSFVDNIFVSEGEMIEGLGEDSFAYSLNDKYGFIAAFDGCGGIGSRKYEIYENKTGAYIASHNLAQVTLDWFRDFSDSGDELGKDISLELYDVFTEKLKRIESQTTATAIKGSLTKSFPTTASLIFFKRCGRRIYASFVWAGDSRGFILTSDGLCQITTDDIDADEDALSNLTSDSRLINVVSAAGDYKLNYRGVKCPPAGVLISATDGSFGYFKTPMEFEYMLINALSKSESIDEWQSNINAYIAEYTGDDFTLAVAVYGYKSFRMLKRMFIVRKKQLYMNCIRKLADATDEEKLCLWNEYKKNYYRGIK